MKDKVLTRKRSKLKYSKTPSLIWSDLLYGCFFSAKFSLYIAVKVDGFLLFVLVSCYIRIYLFEVHRMEKKEKY